MRCHPRSRVSKLNGNALHDWHAEILAIRAFNRFLVRDCADLAANGLNHKSKWLEWREAANTLEEQSLGGQQPFALQNDVSIHMYVSEAPCGDASMELTMRQQEDATPWTSTPPTDDALSGRGHFDQLGIVRRKPARGDAPESWSKSCSDKLAMKQCTGLLSCVLNGLVWPGNVYLKSLVLPESQYVAEACERAFGAGGRMAPLSSKRWEGYAYRPFTMQTTKREFEYSRRSVGATKGTDISALFTPYEQEVLINGVRSGTRWDHPRAGSYVCRRSMWKAVLDVAVKAGLPALANVVGKSCYGQVKASTALEGREQVKRDVRALALKGWKRNDGDEDWSLEEGNDSQEDRY